MSESLSHDIAASLQCWKLLIPCHAHQGIPQKPDTEQESLETPLWPQPQHFLV